MFCGFFAFTIRTMDTFIASQWIVGANQVVGRMTLCKHCGYNASDESIYCIMCGKKLSTSDELHGGVMWNLKNMLRGHTTDDEATV